MASGFSEAEFVFQQGCAGDTGWLVFSLPSEKAAIWDPVLLEGGEARDFLWQGSFFLLPPSAGGHRLPQLHLHPDTGLK